MQQACNGIERSAQTHMSAASLLTWASTLCSEFKFPEPHQPTESLPPPLFPILLSSPTCQSPARREKPCFVVFAHFHGEIPHYGSLHCWHNGAQCALGTVAQWIPQEPVGARTSTPWSSFFVSVSARSRYSQINSFYPALFFMLDHVCSSFYIFSLGFSFYHVVCMRVYVCVGVDFLWLL